MGLNMAIVMQQALASLVFFIAAQNMAHCSPPPSVKCSGIDHNCTLSNAYGVWPDRSLCRAAEVAYPKTEAEIVSSVAYGVKNRMKMKVVSKLSHSIPKIACPGGKQGLVISTRDLDKSIQIDVGSMAATVDSGVQLNVFLDSIAKSGLALPASPYWSGLSIGGILSTGAHGSSLLGHGSAVYEYLQNIRLVVPAPASQGFAKIISLDHRNKSFDAARISLGVLGVISKVTFKLQPIFKRSVTNVLTSDLDLENKVVSFGQQYEFGDITWYPSQGSVVFREDYRVSINSSGDGSVKNFSGFRKTSVSSLNAIRTSEEVAEETRNPGALCATANTQNTSEAPSGGWTNDGFTFKGYPVIGFQNNIQAGGTCQNDLPGDLPNSTCPWDPRVHGLFFYETTFSIPLQHIKDFIIDVKKLQDVRPYSLCGVDFYNGFFMRYVKKSTAFLGPSRDSIDIDINYYRSKDPTTPRLNEDIIEEIEQMAMNKYKGLPHWGKNRPIAFQNADTKYSKMKQFLQTKFELDPDGLFSSEWSDAILGISGNELSSSKDFCALEGLCICSEDRHCAPQKNYVCRHGYIFEDARVCRYVTNEMKEVGLDFSIHEQIQNT